MKNIKKILLLFIFTITFSISSINSLEAKEMAIYPIYGYNTENNICQIKQYSKTSPINKNLKWNYRNIRECRSDNPKIILNTWAWILIWFIIIIFSFSLHNFIIPKFKTTTKIEKTISFLQDIVFMGIALFFIILLQHYFNIPNATYWYTSDIDHIIYSTLINKGISLLFALAYLTISFIRFAVVYYKRK